jgi:hypothetical protein
LGFEICSNLELGGSTVWNPGSKHVEEHNLRLQICSSLKSGGLTVWHFESQHDEEVNLRLQICSSLKLGGSTVWHLNPNMLGGDLAWGLPKPQIELSNGLAFESKHVGG